MPNACLQIKGTRVEWWHTSFLPSWRWIWPPSRSGWDVGCKKSRDVRVESCSLRNGPRCWHRQGKQISLDVSILKLRARGSLWRQRLWFSPPSLAPQWEHCCMGYLLNDKMISEGDSQNHNLFFPPFIGKQPCPSLYVFSVLCAPTVISLVDTAESYCWQSLGNDYLTLSEKVGQSLSRRNTETQPWFLLSKEQLWWNRLCSFKSLNS